jgi:hypothetical protein
MKVQLDPKVLATADRTFIVSALSKIANKKPDTWLTPPHAASGGGLSLKWPGASRVPAEQIIDGIALSAPTHCVDGWGFVSRALSSLVAGDNHAARHMAYYAQLRAALSLLANLGVGVFNGVNVVVNSAGHIERVDPASKKSDRGLGTHHIVWLALKEWANEPASAAIFLDLVKLRGISLNEILAEVWPGFASVGAAGGLIEAWGLDLRTGLDERKHRNISSYSPQALNPLNIEFKSTLRFLDHIWRLFEPSASGSFDALDRHLLRSVLWKQQTLMNPRVSFSAAQYANLPTPIQMFAGADFLTGATDPTKLELLRLAEAKTSQPSPLNMISRALLLLRMATAFTQTSLIEAGVDRAAGALRPWLDELGDARGFWPLSAPMEDVNDLWEDTKMALEELNDVRRLSPASMNDWRAAGLKGVPLLQEAERVVMWSFSR